MIYSEVENLEVKLNHIRSKTEGAVPINWFKPEERFKKKQTEVENKL